MEKDFIWQDSNKDFNFNLKYNGKPRKWLREIKYNCLTNLSRTFFRAPISKFMFKSRKVRTLFLFPGSRSHILAPKFETLLFDTALFIYSFVLSDYHSLNCKFYFLEKQKFLSLFLENGHFLLEPLQ